MRRLIMTGALAAMTVLHGSDLAHSALCDGISSASSTPMTTVLYLDGLTRPLYVVSPPGDVERVFILEQDGRILLVKNGELQTVPFLDISALTRSPSDGGGNEEGLLGLAFHPSYASTGWFFVYHTDTTGANNLVARYSRSATDPDRADTASRQSVISFAHPGQTNHNGGQLAFGPDDGYLYIGTGDGGGACDIPGNAQNLNVNLGKLLRINVNALPYTIPSDNPFVGLPGNDEIWSYGLRNPWRWAFDRLNADLYIGDVGQQVWEELNWRAGTSTGRENYGWRNYEGMVCPNPSCPGAGSCTVLNYVPPVAVYDQRDPGKCAITGGYVYRGCRMPSLAGTYFYADYCLANILSLRMVGGVPTAQTDRTAELAPGGGLTISEITSFGEDARGELFIVDRGGEVFKIVPLLSNLEVSGAGAAAFVPSGGDWVWEDLQLSSSHPISEYRVYRGNGNGSGPFDCVHRTATNSWIGGDPSHPVVGSAFGYLVVAVNADGVQSSPGTGSGGQTRTLSALACP